ncbi:C4-dicarboxylate ABC transporter [Spirochaetia bacterium]|nr:C4-dicarboxylate ABC transporter [Spirochaetia bacterium]
MNSIRKIYKGLCRAELFITGVGFMLLITLVFLSAILRMFHVSMSWNIDLAMLLLAWSSFLGADCAYRDGQLIGIDLLTRNLPKKLQKIIEIFIFLIILCALCFVVYFGVRLAFSEWIRKFQSMPIPFSVVTLSICLASASMIVSSIIKIKNCIKNFNNTEAKA